MGKIIQFVANVYLAIAFLCLLALIGILSIEIVCRYFFSSSIIWSQELFSILICWITFLGFGKLVVDRQDISITFLIDKLDPFKRKIVNVTNYILLMMTSIVMLFFSVNLTINHLDKTTIIMKAPTAWFYAPLVLLLALVVLVSGYQMMSALKAGKLQEGG
ncbi:TRAP transporter small permease subunit [Siminovitchia sp. FSL H7-0308]|uniref:TRAP transporter small permease n=1 Tax=unclassified Siminovitchia TaxID=2837530 RepID=UPI0030D0EA52